MKTLFLAWLAIGILCGCSDPSDPDGAGLGFQRMRAGGSVRGLGRSGPVHGCGHVRAAHLHVLPRLPASGVFDRDVRCFGADLLLRTQA